MSDWRHRARCRDVEPETFFPVGTTGPAAAQTQAAKAICALCPVKDECLEWALGAGSSSEYGVWGGLTEEERRGLRRQQGPRHGSSHAYNDGCRCPRCCDGHARRLRAYRAQKKASA
jgi:WhiB family redox-sensing transcriptional regulator